MLHGSEVLIDAGRRADALTVIAQARRAAAGTGSPNAVSLAALAEARLRLRMDRDPAAARVALDRIEADRLVRTNREVVDTWYGLALLMECRNEEALARLRQAVAGMVAGDRWLELPTAAVYLAEACWRLGDEEAADRAADLALQAAGRHGSNHLLLQALGDFPSVLSRRLDAEAGADSPWHHVGRALIAQGVPLSSAPGAVVELKEFGGRAIVVNGTEVRPRMAKAYEVLAYLVSDGRGGASRDELLDALFEARSDHSARSYLGQAIATLRAVLPADALVVDLRSVRFADQLSITSESVDLEAWLAEAARLHGEARLVATLDALAVYDQGEYLPGRRSWWADKRALDLADVVARARLAAAELAFEAGRLEQAQGLTTSVLAHDPTREAAWRLSMRVASSLGDDNGVLAAYQACTRALDAIGLAPAASTREMVEYLRR